MKIGALLAAGRTSEVFMYGETSMVKVPRPDVRAHWARLEAQFTEAVGRQGVSAPVVRDVIDVNSRDAIVFEYITGPSMWELMLAAPGDAYALAGELVAVHRVIQRAGLPEGLPDLAWRMRNKIADVDRLDAFEREEARRLAESLPRGAALLHGDLHPGNVLMSPDGPVVIDWFDAAIGLPLADVVRSSILMRPPVGGEDLAHLPNATPEILHRVLDGYLEGFADLLAHGLDSLVAWEAVVAASRMAEGLQNEEAGLAALWETRADRDASTELTRAASIVSSR